MSARLTPLHRFAPHLHTLPASDEASAVELPIPLPPATTGACWASTAARMQRQAERLNELQCACHAMDAGDRSAHHTLEPHERITLQLPPDVPALTVPEQIEAARSAGFNAGVRVGAYNRSRWDVLVGLAWGTVLGVLLTCFGAWMGWLVLPTADGDMAAPVSAPAAPAERGGSTIALAMLVVAVPVRRSAAARTARPPTWWTDAPHRACDVCTMGSAGPTGRVCSHQEVVRYAGGQPVPVAHARAADGMCGTDARHHVLA